MALTSRNDEVRTQQIIDGITNYDNTRITIRLYENGPKEKIVPGK